MECNKCEAISVYTHLYLDQRFLLFFIVWSDKEKVIFAVKFRQLNKGDTAAGVTRRLAPWLYHICHFLKTALPIKSAGAGKNSWDSFRCKVTFSVCMKYNIATRRKDWLEFSNIIFWVRRIGALPLLPGASETVDSKCWTLKEAVRIRQSHLSFAWLAGLLHLVGNERHKKNRQYFCIIFAIIKCYLILNSKFNISTIFYSNTWAYQLF